MSINILIYGAGAIGRGYLPWILKKNSKISYVEKDQSLLEYFENKNFFFTMMIENNKYKKKKVFFERIFIFGKEKEHLKKFDLIILCAGVRNIEIISKNLINYNKKILILENDINIKKILIETLNKKNNIFFGVPDVISSNTASLKIKKEYGEKTVITENGICYLEKKLEDYFDKAVFLTNKELVDQWICKLYIHNTTHCILAYLGHIIGLKYIHEIANLKFAKKILHECFSELSKLLVLKYKIDIKIINYYSKKEIIRFSNKLLFDPIDRVAREPFRKLKVDERLIGAANQCFSYGVYPLAISFGIFCAFQYRNRKDADFNISYLINSLRDEDFLEIVLGLRKGEPLYEILIYNWNKYEKKIVKLKNLIKKK
jgi:ketopantoate reductase